MQLPSPATPRQLEEELAAVEASIKEHAHAWLELDKRKTKHKELGGLYSLAGLGGLLILTYYSSGPAIQGFVVGAAVIGAGWWYETRGDAIRREMEKLHWLRREAEHRRDLLRARGTVASAAHSP